MAKRAKKLANILDLIRYHVKNGTFLLARHAQERSFQRGITEPEFLFVLRNGWHEKRKDAYQTEFNAWNYAIRGKTIDERELRVIVAFDIESQLLIITLIDLDADEG